MSDLDNKLKSHVKANLIGWMSRASWFFAGVAAGILLVNAF